MVNIKTKQNKQKTHKVIKERSASVKFKIANQNYSFLLLLNQHKLNWKATVKPQWNTVSKSENCNRRG